MQGLKHCSSSYATGTYVTTRTLGQQRCPARKPATQRLRVVAAESKDVQLVQTRHGSRIPAPSNAFFPQRVSLREAQNGEWVDKVDDWAAFWEDDYMTYDYDLDDTHDALMGAHCQSSHIILHCLLCVCPIFAARKNTCTTLSMLQAGRQELN